MNVTPLKKPVRLTWDSGAFSVSNKVAKITPEEYGEFIINHGAAHCRDYVNLDVIPAGSTESDTESAARASWQNLKRLQKMGLKPMPVYHLGERYYWLEKMLGDGHTHIGVGLSRTDRRERQWWLDELFMFLCGDCGYPSVKVHGFGITAIPMMTRYPWYTVDSVTWRKMAAYGWILAPFAKRPDGQFDFCQSWRQISCGAGGREKHNGRLAGDVGYGGKGGTLPASVLRNGNHLRCDVAGIRLVREWLELEGFDPDDLLNPKTQLTTLCRVNVRFFRRFEEQYVPQPFIARRDAAGFFNFHAAGDRGSAEPAGKFHILYGVSNDAMSHRIMTAERRRNRLLSFVYFRKKHPFNIADYVQTGLVKLTEKKPHGKSKRS